MFHRRDLVFAKNAKKIVYLHRFIKKDGGNGPMKSWQPTIMIGNGAKSSLRDAGRDKGNSSL